MKVAVDFRLARYGGTGTYVRTLVEGLALRGGIDLVILGPDAYRNTDVPHAARKCPYFPCEVPPFSLREQVVIPHLLRAVGADLLHVPYYNFPLRAHVPVIVAVHDLIWFHPEHVKAWRPAVQYSRFMIRKAGERAKAIVTGSTTARNEFVSRFPAFGTAVVVTPYAIAPSLRGAVQAASETPREEDLLLYVGTFRPSKRVEVLVHAVADLHARGMPVRLILAGGPARYTNQDIGSLVHELHLDSAVTLRGPVSDGELARLYRRATLYIMPSEYEGFGLTTVEAMAAECPVVAADLPIHREVAGQAAAYFAPSNVKNLADQIAHLLNAPHMRIELGRLGGIRAKTHTIERLCSATAAVYEQVRTELASK